MSELGMSLKFIVAAHLGFVFFLEEQLMAPSSYTLFSGKQIETEISRQSQCISWLVKQERQ